MVSVEVLDQDDNDGVGQSQAKKPGDGQGLNAAGSGDRPLSEHMQSVGGSTRSMARSTRLAQRIQELNDKQKIARWEGMLAEYFSAGMQGFNAMRNLRQRVCRSLNETQAKFVSYLGRQSDQ